MSQLTQEKENSSEKIEEKITVKEEKEREKIEESTESNIEKEIPVINKKDIAQEKENQDESKIDTKISISTSRTKIIIFSSIILIVFVCLFSTIFALINNSSNKILKNHFVSGIDISNLSKEEALQKITQEIENRKTRQFNVYSGEQVTSITEEELNITYNTEEVVNAIYSKGRTGNILKDNYTILSSNFSVTNIDLEPYFSNEEQEVNYFISDLQNVLPGKVTNFNYEVDGDELIVTPGTSGLKIIEQELKNNILQKAKDYNTDNILATYETINPEKITAEELQKQIYVEPKDAYYETTPKFIIYPHVVGIDFAISLEEVQKILDENKEEYIIPLKLTNPSKLTSDIGSENFPDLLGTYSTNYDASNISRSNNLKIASNKINGTILLPGETFSYNKVVGKRTIEAGFENAAVYQGGKMVDGIGGGICQVSSTLYNAVLYANLEIVERRNHGLRVSYAPLGRDATVSYGAIDFKFKNTRTYPIKIKSYCSGGVCKFEIYGIFEDVEYDVSLYVDTLSTTPFSTEYEDTTSLAEGATKVEQNGMNGAKTKTYKTLKLNGTVIKTELLSTDIYKPMTKIILKGVSSTPATSTTTPVVTPELPQVPSVPETPITTPEPTTPEVPSLSPEDSTTVVPSTPDEPDEPDNTQTPTDSQTPNPPQVPDPVIPPIIDNSEKDDSIINESIESSIINGL